MENSSLEKDQHAVHTRRHKDVCNITLCSVDSSLWLVCDLNKSTHVFKGLWVCRCVFFTVAQIKRIRISTFKSQVFLQAELYGCTLNANIRMLKITATNI